jgi:secreted trypsin-like serine protease
VQFRCGATLVSKKLVITAAHCIYDEQLKRSLTPTEVVLFLGRFNIKSWSETDYLARDVEQLIVHEDFKVRSEASFDADIGLMIMKKPAIYNQYIRPICLWTGSTELNEIVGQNGIVTGWGRDDSGAATTTTPRTVTVPIVSNKVCLAEHESFRYITSPRTFCAGRKDGRGPCNGDSGGGLIITRNGQSYLRGIVSAGLRDPKTGFCNLNSYIVFTDVALFSNWIRPHL